jgi:hypothetical protein
VSLLLLIANICIYYFNVFTYNNLTGTFIMADDPPTDWARLHAKIHHLIINKEACSYNFIVNELGLPPLASIELKKYIEENFRTLDGFVTAHELTKEAAASTEEHLHDLEDQKQKLIVIYTDMIKEKMIRAHISDTIYDDICTKAAEAAVEIYNQNPINDLTRRPG